MRFCLLVVAIRRPSCCSSSPWRCRGSHLLSPSYASPMIAAAVIVVEPHRRRPCNDRRACQGHAPAAVSARRHVHRKTRGGSPRGGIIPEILKEEP